MNSHCVPTSVDPFPMKLYLIAHAFEICSSDVNANHMGTEAIFLPTACKLDIL